MGPVKRKARDARAPFEIAVLAVSVAATAAVGAGLAHSA
jgi:hypothetical protein